MDEKGGFFFQLEKELETSWRKIVCFDLIVVCRLLDTATSH